MVIPGPCVTNFHRTEPVRVLTAYVVPSRVVTKTLPDATTGADSDGASSSTNHNRCRLWTEDTVKADSPAALPDLAGSWPNTGESDADARTAPAANKAHKAAVILTSDIQGRFAEPKRCRSRNCLYTVDQAPTIGGQVTTACAELTSCLILAVKVLRSPSSAR